MDKHEIEYEVIAQRPGDIVYVKPGTFHQVLNVNPNLAEAINFGDAAWNLANPICARTCQCEFSKISVIPSNRRIITLTTIKRFVVYDCPSEGCRFDTTSKTRLERHVRKEHRDQRALIDPFKRIKQDVYCKLCKSSYRNFTCHLKTSKHILGTYTFSTL